MSSNLYGLATIGCTTVRPCLQLHNGAVLQADQDIGYFGGTATTQAIFFFLDPDGKITDGTTNGPGKSVRIFLYYNGAIRTSGTMLTGTGNVIHFPGGSPDPSLDPPWFHW